MTFQIINPEELGGRPKGWSNGMLGEAGGRVLFVAGQTASEVSGAMEVRGFVEQTTRALEKVVAVVREAGGQPEHIGRITLFVTDIEAYRSNLSSLGTAYRRVMGRHFPAMSLVGVASLVDPHAVVEIEATAVLPLSIGG